MTHKHSWSNKTAIVIGSSMAGLLAARVLANYVEQVTLIERDTFPAAGENRKGVPQGRHAHAVLAHGLQIMEGFFPGLIDTLISAGADYGDASELARWYHEGDYHQPAASGINAINISRPHLEAEIRTRLLALPNLQAWQGCDVLGLLTTPDSSRVTGVRVIRRRPGSAEETLSADLVIDASGRGSRSPAWLADLGYERPPEESVKIGVNYTSCTYERRPEHMPGVNALIMAASPEDPRVGVLLSQEDNRWILTVAAYMGEQIPLDHDGLCAYVRSMASPHLYEVIKDARPLSDPVAHKIPTNLRRRYDRLRRFPAGYLVIGDALCSFNPIYGQGMSVAALEAQALGVCLAGGEHTLAQRFFTRAAQIIDTPWSTAVGNDLRLPAIEGPRTLMTRFINWYITRLHRAAHHDALVSAAFLKVIHLLAPPPSLLHPAVVWRVLRGNLRTAAITGHTPQLHPGIQKER
ncbi:MAG TPA: FAD-dependent monooxygenase [Roseiflexaceae bacterium]|nr:FAD-dependent monooxygenase [Roseiflexaceae bacterium]